MPIASHDKEYGGKPSSAAKALKAMGNTCGKKKGKSVFHALANKRKKQGGY